MTRWYKEKKKEFFYNEAKRKGYRSRSAFKLKQIQKKYKIINKKNFVLDLGAAPGGWSQVAYEIVEKKGKIIGIDLLYVKPIEGIQFLQEDITKKSTMSRKLLIFLYLHILNYNTVYKKNTRCYTGVNPAVIPAKAGIQS